MSFLLNVNDVLNYAGEGNRKFIEGENIVNSNHLINCGIINESDEETTLIFLCVKSSDLFGSPYETKVIITKNTDKYKKLIMSFNSINLIKLFKQTE